MTAFKPLEALNVANGTDKYIHTETDIGTYRPNCPRSLFKKRYLKVQWDIDDADEVQEFTAAKTPMKKYDKWI